MIESADKYVRQAVMEDFLEAVMAERESERRYVGSKIL